MLSFKLVFIFGQKEETTKEIFGYNLFTGRDKGMENKNTTIAGYVQATVAVLSASGIAIAPEHTPGISLVAMVLYGALSAIKGHFTKDK